MTSTANKNLSEPANGSTSWDVPLNANFTNTDVAFGGTQFFNLASASGTVAVSGSTFIGSYPANTASYIPIIWSLTGVLTANVNLQVPSGVGGQWTVGNACTGAFTVTISSAAGGTTVVVAQGRATIVAINSGGAFFSNATPATTITLPTVQNFLGGSGTYTKPANVTWIRVRGVGGGGGGAGGGSSAGAAPGNGGNTTFGAQITASGGVQGAWNATTVASGGAATFGASSPGGIAIAGGAGQPTTAVLGVGGLRICTGGIGGSSALGGNGAGGALTTGSSGATNSGGGGGGGGCSDSASVVAGNGGGAGGFVDCIINSPSATYAYAVGAAGNAGGGGPSGFQGGFGGSGGISVEEHYGS